MRSAAPTDRDVERAAWARAAYATARDASLLPASTAESCDLACANIANRCWRARPRGGGMPPPVARRGRSVSSAIPTNRDDRSVRGIAGLFVRTGPRSAGAAPAKSTDDELRRQTGAPWRLPRADVGRGCFRALTGLTHAGPPVSAQEQAAAPGARKAATFRGAGHEADRESSCC